jgi:hypothetical protein
MMKRGLITGLITLFMLSAGIAVHAEETVKKNVINSYQETRDICFSVKNLLADRLDTKEVTKASIELGHDACLVVRCAIEANGDIENIIKGAIEAGASSDVCSRCAIDAGVDPADVARILDKGLGYPVASALTPIDIHMPVGEPGGGFISSSGF